MADDNTPTTEQILQELWDDGNAVGLDGYTGPGRGDYVVDGEAIEARRTAIKKARDLLSPAIRQIKAEALREAVADMRRAREGSWNLRDPRDPEVAYSVDVWLEVRADRIAAGGDQT